MTVIARAALAAACQRELAANLVNRFLHVHLALAAIAGLLPLFTPDAAAASAPLWVLQAVLYCLSLSAILIGLSSAHADTDEFALIFAQPAPRGAWLAGKAAALAVVLAGAALLLVLPSVVIGGVTGALLGLAGAAAGVTFAMAAIGLAVGFWIRDPVRGLLGAIGVWFLLLFGTDLLLLAISGAPWIQGLTGLWVGVLMANPLDALRITVLFGVEQIAFAGLDVSGIVRWWIAHGWTWLAFIVTLWSAGALTVARAGARRRLDA